MSGARVSLSGSSGTVTYGCDGGGLLATRTAGGTTTNFVYDGDTPVAELSPSGTVTAVNTFGPSGLAARTTASGSVFYTFDDEGNTDLRTDTNGNVLDAHAYDAFGNELTPNTTKDPYAGFGAQFGYYRDYQANAYLLGHRFYNPSNGRFVNRDPAGVMGGINLYMYAGNDPVDNMDPTGFWSVYKWMYTGDGDASDCAYEAALDVVAEAIPTRRPDYVSFNIGRLWPLGKLPLFNRLPPSVLTTKVAAGVSPTVWTLTFDRYGHVYISPGISVGTEGYGFSVVAGYISTGTDMSPWAAQISGFITSHSWNYNTGTVAGVGQTWSEIGSSWYHANEFGLSYLDNIGLGYSYGILLYSSEAPPQTDKLYRAIMR